MTAKPKASAIHWKNIRVKLGDLKPWDKNPRKSTKEQAARILESFRKFGQVELIAIGPDLTVYDGHQRLSALLALHGKGYAIDARQASRALTIGERRRLVIALHAGATGSWDWDVLKDWNPKELLGAGFDRGLLGDLRKDVAGVSALIKSGAGQQVDVEPKVGQAQALRRKWKTKAGQLWELGDHLLLCGDSTDPAAVARVTQGERAPLAWCDPPFGIDLRPQRKKNERIQGDENDAARILWAAFAPLLFKSLLDNAHAFLCQDWTEFGWTLPVLLKAGFIPKAEIIWNKNVWGIGYFVRPKHESIIYCQKGKPGKIREPIADVWDEAREAAPQHAAEKPPGLCSNAIGHFSDPGALVVDLFSGLGSTLIACENLGRRCRAIEISPAYVAVALQRWADLTGKTPRLVNS